MMVNEHSSCLFNFQQEAGCPPASPRRLCRRRLGSRMPAWPAQPNAAFDAGASSPYRRSLQDAGARYELYALAFACAFTVLWLACARVQHRCSAAFAGGARCRRLSTLGFCATLACALWFRASDGAAAGALASAERRAAADARRFSDLQLSGDLLRTTAAQVSSSVDAAKCPAPFGPKLRRRTRHLAASAAVLGAQWKGLPAAVAAGGRLLKQGGASATAGAAAAGRTDDGAGLGELRARGKGRGATSAVAATALRTLRSGAGCFGSICAASAVGLVASVVAAAQGGRGRGRGRGGGVGVGGGVGSGGGVGGVGGGSLFLARLVAPGSTLALAAVSLSLPLSLQRAVGLGGFCAQPDASVVARGLSSCACSALATHFLSCGSSADPLAAPLRVGNASTASLLHTTRDLGSVGTFCEDNDAVAAAHAGALRFRAYLGRIRAATECGGWAREYAAVKRTLCAADGGAAAHSRAALLGHVALMPLLALSTLLLACSSAAKRKQGTASHAIVAVEEPVLTPEEDAYLLRIKAMAENRHLSENESWGGGGGF